MSAFTLFEISWEVCNKVGGIHTVLTTKAPTAVARFGDEYVTVGPWLLASGARDDAKVPFDDDPAFSDFCDTCRQMGLPVRVGRWRVRGRPRCILVEFSSLYERKDDVLARLWEDYQVDSIAGQWDYIEPVLFGYAAGRVIEEWWERYLAPFHRRAVVQAHEWMTASSLLYLKNRIPAVGTVFTTHATMLGRALSSLGHSPEDGLGDRTAAALAETHKVQAKHSMESSAAREADVFTTVSAVTAKEAELLHHRAPSPLLPNGIDLDVIDELIGKDLDASRAKVLRFASRFLGVDVSNAVLCCISGRYEFHNKGLDVFLDALGKLNGTEGRPIVAFVLVPAGNSGIRAEVRERLDDDAGAVRDPIGVTTHNLFDEERDAVRGACARLGLENATGDRIKVVQIPVYLHGDDGLLDLRYEAVLAAMDFSAFPSFYEPWGYTPQESLAAGVPTITSDYAGFGRWARTEKLTEADGVTVVERVGRPYDDVVATVAEVVERLVAQAGEGDRREVCRATAQRTAWADLFANYETAYANALAAIQARLTAGVPVTRRPRAESAAGEKPSQAPHLLRFDVAPSLPDALRPLERLSRNFWWCWDHDAPALFTEIAPETWRAADHNPVAFLQRAAPEDLEAKAADASFVARVEAAAKRFDAYLAARSERFDLGEGAALTSTHPVAYFCAEFGIHESLPIYSGGLGVLAGDHLKSASDLDLPLVGVGLFYRMGYMAQQVTADGQQLAIDRENDPGRLPLELVRDRESRPLEVVIPMPGRDLYLRAWRVAVGRVSLYLLDANTPSNREEDRGITQHLYGGDHEMRIRQLIALGRGGVRLLERLGIEPAAFHMNEGHAAFSSLERVGKLVRDDGLTFEAARECVRRTTAFTTHTPVPAGHDRFAEDLVRRYFSDASDWCGVPWDRFIALGRADESEADFNMTYLAMYFSAWCNGVSELHGIASRRLLHPYWPGLLESEVPVESVTNGVHLPTWVHPHVAALVGGPPVTGEAFARRAGDVDPGELWAVREELRGALVEELRARIQRAFVRRSDSPLLLQRTLDGLDDDALWIGFARRFAPYKRAHLLFQDLERLRAICDAEDRPVRIVVAGKAHPRDEAGQGILRSVVEHTRKDGLVGRVFFVEDYDIALARKLVQGVDVWLNTPTRMLEASGTSGMKAAANGVLNLSIADGWWPEAADGENGWTLARGRVYENQALQDESDANALYTLLESEVVPAFFDRDDHGVPQDWMRRVIHDLATVPCGFNTDRMVGDYLDAAYRPLGRAYFAQRADKLADTRRAAEEGKRVRKGFAELRILDAELADPRQIAVGDTIEVSLQLDLGSLTVDDVDVELVVGGEAGKDDLADPVVIALAPEPGEGAVRTFKGRHRIGRSGGHAHGLRVRARRYSSSPSSLRGLVLWA